VSCSTGSNALALLYFAKIGAACTQVRRLWIWIWKFHIHGKPGCSASTLATAGLVVLQIGPVMFHNYTPGYTKRYKLSFANVFRRTAEAIGVRHWTTLNRTRSVYPRVLFSLLSTICYYN